mmetsp:Transcript_21819/g.50168  ORF Transcript_21819/g.50168 Transcript_21819/m.50168 type:complete len:264 (-) Transcript_21819:589-1380(-)
MACRSPRVGHPLVGACEDVRARAHGAADEHGLPSELVVDGDERVVRREGARRALAVHKQRARTPVDQVLFHLCDVVRNVVHDRHVKLVRSCAKCLRESLPRQKSHRRAVHPCVVGGGAHACEVCFPLRRVDPRARELPVVGDDLVASHRLLHLHERIRRHLVAETSRARMDQHANLSLPLKAHLRCRLLVEDLLHHLNLCVVVARAKCAELRQTALLRTCGDSVGVGAQHPTVLLAVLFVLSPSVALAHGPVHAHLERLLQVR